MDKWWLVIVRIFGAVAICFVLFAMFALFDWKLVIPAPTLKVETHLLGQMHVASIVNDTDKTIKINSVVINDGSCEAVFWLNDEVGWVKWNWWVIEKRKLPPDGMVVVRYGVCQEEDRIRNVLIKTDDGDHLFGVE